MCRQLSQCTPAPFFLYLFSHRCLWILLIGWGPFSYWLHLRWHCLGFLSERDRGLDLVCSLQMRVFELFCDGYIAFKFLSKKVDELYPIARFHCRRVPTQCRSFKRKHHTTTRVVIHLSAPSVRERHKISYVAMLANLGILDFCLNCLQTISIRLS